MIDFISYLYSLPFYQLVLFCIIAALNLLIIIKIGVVFDLD